MATGQVIGTIHATDLDINAIIYYSISENSYVAIGNDTGELTVIFPFDYE